MKSTLERQTCESNSQNSFKGCKSFNFSEMHVHVSTYGSVPLKTYLPDGDIDLSTFSWEPHSSELWASELQSLLKCEEQSKRSKFCVRDAQIINAEVQIVKCLVDDVVVDISFNQLGGICTLCFLEEIDRLVGKDHLFKRSIILVKAWCYYESRILGAHHGLISTYALETLVLYIFNLFHITIRGPFEVLCKFLQFFSQFDWKRYCISLLGPICLTDLHGVNMELPNTDPSTLLFNHDFISTCRHVYGVPFQGTQNLRFKNFSSKNMNIIDPLRLDNNLGRSVNKGNFFRICSALAYGAKQTERILHRSLEDIPEILHDFFRNTKKHCDQCHLDGFTFRIGNMSSQSSSCLPGYSEDKCEMNLSVVESFCEDASKTMNETKNSTSVMGDMTLRCKPEDISGLSSCGAGYHGESTYPSGTADDGFHAVADGIAHQDRYFKSLRESSVSSGCDTSLVNTWKVQESHQL
ncbi:hypothetical protein KP509_1Z083000 [Ceratopteris richardii]|nr:hypothetical protein KP509_1Z083000 [Ceratopteris richardii]